jgi:hypothetical protein
LSRRKKKIKKKKKEDEEKGKAGSFEVHVKADCKRACVEEPEAKAKPCSLLRLILMSLELLSLSLLRSNHTFHTPSLFLRCWRRGEVRHKKRLLSFVYSS